LTHLLFRAASWRASTIPPVLAGLPYTSNLNFNGGDTRIDF
jgi:hypothetical protein